MAWWIWLLLGMAFVMLELQIASSFFLLGFGIGAFAVGLLVAVGVGGAAWLQWLLFSVLSIVAVLLLRRFVRVAHPTPWSGEREIDSMVGAEAVVLDDLPAGGVGRAELRGTTWTARSAGDHPLAKGQRCRVTRVEGLTVWLQAQ